MSNTLTIRAAARLETGIALKPPIFREGQFCRATCGGCRRWKPLDPKAPLCGRCVDGQRPGIIGRLVPACVAYAAKGKRR